MSTRIKQKEILTLGEVLVILKEILDSLATIDGTLDGSELYSKEMRGLVLASRKAAAETIMMLLDMETGILPPNALDLENHKRLDLGSQWAQTVKEVN